MKIEVEIISQESIKPSSPNLNHPRHYQLSFLDQVSPRVYNPLVLFYLSSDRTYKYQKQVLLDRLKTSLSRVLTYYYPLAGRVINDTFIDCNDTGIPFSEARVHCQLPHFLHNPIPIELNKLVPFELDLITEIPFGVQVNFFDCGGVAIGACLSHQVSDALSFFVFLNAWAMTCRGVQAEMVAPKLDPSAKLFPPRDITGYDTRVGIIKDNIVCKRFVFDAVAIERLRAKWNTNDDDDNYQKRPSRVEALSAFIWSRYVAATFNHRVESGPHAPIYTVVHAVNLRPRMEPPLPEHAFGNYYRISITVPSLSNKEECHGVVRQVREEIKKIDKEFVKRLQEGKDHLNMIKARSNAFVKGEIVSFGFTSLCRFPLYESDFGWGNPTWVGSPALTFKNLAIFIDSKEGDGIEAYVSLKVEDMAKFENDKELLSYVTSP